MVVRDDQTKDVIIKVQKSDEYGFYIQTYVSCTCAIIIWILTLFFLFFFCKRQKRDEWNQSVSLSVPYYLQTTKNYFELVIKNAHNKIVKMDEILFLSYCNETYSTMIFYIRLKDGSMRTLEISSLWNYVKFMVFNDSIHLEDVFKHLFFVTPSDIISKGHPSISCLQPNLTAKPKLRSLYSIMCPQVCLFFPSTSPISTYPQMWFILKQNYNHN
jgi:hypothetical protein